MRACLGAALVAIVVSSGGGARAEGSLACEREMTRAAALHGVPLNVLYSVGLTETGTRGELSPYDMNVDGQAVHSTSLAEAMARFEQAKGRGAKFIDIGCMQINHHFHSADFHSLSEMFDPARNVEYAANFLKSLRGAGRLVDAGGGSLQRRPRQSGSGKNLRLLGHPQHDRERFRAMDGERARALSLGARTSLQGCGGFGAGLAFSRGWAPKPVTKSSSASPFSFLSSDLLRRRKIGEAHRGARNVRR